MFRGSYQRKLLTVLYSGGSNPLEIWDIKVKNGWTRRVKDEDMGTIVFEVAGTNVATAYIVSPPDPRAVLAITLPFITMFIKNLNRYFTFEIQILDDKQMRRRFRFSNYQSSTKVRPFTCSVPLALKPGWNQIQLNLANFTTRAYGTNYLETQRVQIHANCRIRRVYFSDRLYAEEELPRDYRIFMNVRQAPAVPQQTAPQADIQEAAPAQDVKVVPSSILKRTSKTGDISVPLGLLETMDAKTSMKTSPSALERQSTRSTGSAAQTSVTKSVNSMTDISEGRMSGELKRNLTAISVSSQRSLARERSVEGNRSVTFIDTVGLQEEGDKVNEREGPGEPELELSVEVGQALEESEEVETPRSELPELELTESEPLPESDVEYATEPHVELTTAEPEEQLNSQESEIPESTEE